MDELLENIENSFREIDSSSYNYKIEARFPYDGNYVDITGMFKSLKEIKEVGITLSNRRIIAKNIDGYEELRDMGFKDKEIIKAY
jgi:hypothetical protein